MTHIDLPSDLTADDPQFVARLNDALRRLSDSSSQGSTRGPTGPPGAPGGSGSLVTVNGTVVSY
jgi:hypothetical protein